ncbi:MAG TPA: hypothetical protein VLB68_14685 [Pyrinomonadaceae bacterium]|nr:hypothetical protein [Pyrinomonadaceae bacterium]
MHIRHEHQFAVKVVLRQYDVAAKSRSKQAETMQTNAELSLATEFIRVCSKPKVLRRDRCPYQNAIAVKEYIFTKKPREFTTQTFVSQELAKVINRLVKRGLGDK